MRIMRTGISVLTKALDCTPHGGGPDPYCHALQEIKGSKVKSKLLEVIIEQLALLRNNTD